MPYFTINSNSRAWVPCGNGPTSEPDGERYARRDLLFEFANLVIQHRMFAGARFRGGGMIGEIFEDDESRAPPEYASASSAAWSGR